MTSKLVTIRGEFKDYSAYQEHRPSKVEFEYFEGKPLSTKDAKKVQRITSWYLGKKLYPVFVLTDEMPDGRLIGEATIDLMRWTNKEYPTPRFKMGIVS